MLRPGVQTAVQIVIPVAGTYTVGPYTNLAGAQYVAAWANMVRTSGGTSIALWLQTSVSDNNEWFDIMRFSWTTTSAKKMLACTAKQQTTVLTPAAATLGSEGVVEVLGDRYRWQYTTVGTYVGTLDLSFYVAGG